jgi:CheY-like chemotaxis protein
MKRILIVEDNDLNRDVLQRRLTSSLPATAVKGWAWPERLSPT